MIKNILYLLALSYTSKVPDNGIWTSQFDPFMNGISEEMIQGHKKEFFGN
jgi:hypothetical protein